MNASWRQRLAGAGLAIIALIVLPIVYRQHCVQRAQQDLRESRRKQEPLPRQQRHAETLLALGVTHSSSGQNLIDLRDQLAALQRQCEQRLRQPSPTNPQGHFQKGLDLYLLDRQTEAEPVLTELAPTHLRASLLLAVLLQELKRYRESDVWFEHTVKQGRDASDKKLGLLAQMQAIDGLAANARQGMRYADAETAYRRGITEVPSARAYFHFQLGRHFSEGGRAMDAIAHLQTAVQLDEPQFGIKATQLIGALRPQHAWLRVTPQVIRRLSPKRAVRHSLLVGWTNNLRRMENAMADKQPTPRQKLVGMITSYWSAMSIHVAAKLGLADLVKDAPKTADQLAAQTKTHPQALYRLLRALASVEIFREDEQNRFHLTPMAECLLDVHGSQRTVALMMGDEHYRTWGELLYSVQTGKPAFDHLYGKPVFDWLSEHPHEAKIFDAAMTGFHGPETQAMIDAYDYSGINTLVDVGGGNGTVLSAVLSKNPALKGILYDLPGVIDRAKKNLADAGLASRCQTIAGSFFESAPSGGDAYQMRHIIHDWTDEQCHTILTNIRKVIPAHGKLLVIEMVIKPTNEPQPAKWLDLNMLVIPGGRERTEAEYRDMYAKAGFRLERLVPTPTEVSVIEGTPV